MTSEELLYVVKLTDELSSTAQKMRSELQKVTGEANNTGGAIASLKAKLQDLGSWAARGFAAAFGFNLFQEFRRGIDALVDAIPNAIKAGDDYLTQIRQIQLETGLSAQSTSTLAGVFGRLGIPFDTLDRTLAVFGKQLASNEGLLHELGISTRDSAGNLLDAQTVLDNTRHAFNAFGTSLVATGAAQELFSRSGYQLLEYLQLSDAQVKQYTTDLSAWGLVVDQSTLNAAEGFNRALTNLQDGFTGLQTTIFAALEPSLRSFVDSFAGFVKDHFVQIASFVVNVTNFVLGVIGGLLGIDFTPIQMLADKTNQAALSYKQWVALQNQGATAGAGAASSIDKQTKAIDAQIAAIRARGQARQQANQQAQLQLSLEKALAQLEDLRANSPFVAGLSNAEQQLALQKHQADLAAAQKAVSDAKKSIVDFGLDARDQAEISALERQKARLQEGAAAAKASYNLQAGYAAYLANFKKQQDDATSASSTSMFATINAAAQSWRDKGVAFAGDLKKGFGQVMDALFGAETGTGRAGMGAQQAATRSGGLIGALGGLSGAFNAVKAIALLLAASFTINLAGSIVNLIGIIGGTAGGLVGALGGLGGALLGLLGPVGLVIALIAAARAAGAGAIGFNPLGPLDTLNKSGWNLGAKLPPPTTWQQALGLPPNFGGTSTSPPPPSAPPVTYTGGSGLGASGMGAILGMASGGYVPPTPGGTIRRLAEGGEGEFVIPESKMDLVGGGMVYAPVFNFNSFFAPTLAQKAELMKLINRELYYQAARQPLPLVSA